MNSNPIGIHLSFALGPSNEVGPPLTEPVQEDVTVVGYTLRLAITEPSLGVSSIVWKRASVAGMDYLGSDSRAVRHAGDPARARRPQVLPRPPSGPPSQLGPSESLTAGSVLVVGGALSRDVANNAKGPTPTVRVPAQLLV